MAEARERKLNVVLSADEREFLIQGLVQWGGPATCTDDIARVIGFSGEADFRAGAKRIVGMLREASPMSGEDWTRALVATELVYASDRYGAGVEWETVSGWGDVESIHMLRGLQRRLVAVGA